MYKLIFFSFLYMMNIVLYSQVPEMVLVEGGTFIMGCNNGIDDEKPMHKVTVKSFYIGKYEVTQKEWVAIMGNNPSYFKGDSLPVEKVSWDDIQEFLVKLNEITGSKYRLPTEAEWEFAAKGGNKSEGYMYAGSNNLNDVAWCGMNSGEGTNKVGTKKPNELGIYDMTGNVWEWCSDRYNGEYYSNCPSENPLGPNDGDYRTLRGGSWNNIEKDCRLTYRTRYYPFFRYYYNGFRLVKEILSF